jgi:hypothetical protein
MAVRWFNMDDRRAMMLFLAIAISGGACSESERCRPIVARVPSEDRSCLGVRPIDLGYCLPVGVARSKKTTGVCVVSPAGELFVSELPQGGRFEGDDWRHSECYPQGSTLTVTEEAACAPLLAPGATVPWCAGMKPDPLYWDF